LAADPALTCEANKLAAAGKYAQCRLRTEAKAVKLGLTADFSRCTQHFDRKWEAAETSGAGACPTLGDAATVLILLAECTASVPGGVTTSSTVTTTSSTTTTTSTSTTTTLACTATSGCFCDLGNLTVLDTCTGLQWEKKNGADTIPGLGVQNFTNPHDVDNPYTWTDVADGDGTDPDGTMFTQFLAALNASVSPDGSTVSGCFAGHCDWRLPQIDELKTLIDPMAPGCGSTAPCIDPIFGPTASAAGNYSTATTVAGHLPFAWVVSFFNGSVSDGVIKYDDDFVRAVRSSGPPATTRPGPKVIFVTLETVTPGDNGPLGFFQYPSRGDEICQRIAAQNSMFTGKRFVAAVCGREPDVAAGADLNLQQRTTDSPGGYVRTDGAKVANNLADLLDGNIQVPISYDQLGRLLPDVESGDVIPVWSGCNAFGQSFGTSLHCSGPSLPSWWFNSSIAYAEVGRPDRADDGWLDDTVNSCIVGRHLYCIEQ
jgi:hypothetical protein